MPLTPFQKAYLRQHSHVDDQIIDSETGDPWEGGGGGLDEAAHDALDHSGLTGVGGSYIQAFPDPTDFDGSDILDGSDTSKFVNVAAFTTKETINNALHLVTTGASRDHRVRVTLGTSKAGVFDLQIKISAFLRAWQSEADTWAEVRLSDTSDVQIAAVRLYAFAYGARARGYYLSAGLGATTPPAAGVQHPCVPEGLPSLLRFTRDGSNVVRGYWAAGAVPLGPARFANDSWIPITATGVTQTLARVEIAFHTPSGPDANSQYELYIPWIANI